MGIEVTALATELDAESVRQSQEELSELMQAFNPRIDARRGVLHDLLFFNEAIYAEKSRVELARLKASQSLYTAQADPLLADADILDAAAGNLRVSRREGGTAAGEIEIVVEELSPLTIAQGTIWEANGVQFITESAFSAVTSLTNVTSITDRVLNPVGDGTYAFTIEVTAINPGVSGLVVKNTLFTTEAIPLGFVKAFAVSDFLGGSDTESNADLVARALEGIACKALSGSVTMGAALRAEPEFATVLETSIIGFGDQEMLRDQHTIWPGSLGGRVDWYIRSQEQAQYVGLVKSAVLVEKNPSGSGVWQFGVSRDDVPGFYDVYTVLPRTVLDGVSLTLVSDIRSADLTALNNDGFLPDIAAAVEAVYSPFQAAVIRFATTAEDVRITDLAVGATLDFNVTLRATPLIRDIQNWAAGRGVRNRAGDVLIKAPIPCFITIGFTIYQPPGYALLDTESIQQDVAQLINRWGFTGRLPASAISDVVHDRLPGVAHTSAIDIFAQLRFPDGEWRTLRTSETLLVPDEPARMVSARTVAFMTTPSAIQVVVETANMPEI